MGANYTMNIYDYCAQNGVSLSTARMRMKNAGFAFDRAQELTPELRVILDAKKRQRKASVKPVVAPTPEVPAPTPPKPDIEAVPPIVNTDNPPPLAKRWQFLLDVPTGAELLTVLVGASWLFSWLGAIVAAACISFYVHTAYEMRESDNSYAQNFGLTVCALLGCVFMWLHGQTFWKVYSGAQDLKFLVCMGCALLLSSISFSALVQTRAVS